MQLRRAARTALIRAAVYLGLRLAMGALWGLLGLLWVRRQLHALLLRRLLKRRGQYVSEKPKPLAAPRHPSASP